LVPLQISSYEDKNSVATEEDVTSKQNSSQAVLGPKSLDEEFNMHSPLARRRREKDGKFEGFDFEMEEEEDYDTASTSSEVSDSSKEEQESDSDVEEHHPLPIELIDSPTELADKFILERNGRTHSPKEIIIEFVQFVLKHKAGNKLRSKDLIKCVKLVPESHLVLGSNGRRSKLVNLLGTSTKFTIGKRITKPKTLVIIRDHSFVDPSGEYERVKSARPDLAHYFSVNMSNSTTLVNAIIDRIGSLEVNMNFLYSAFSNDQRVTSLNRLFLFPSPKLLIRSLLAWDGRFFWQVEGELITLV
jgi:hypothetical protein